jgi:putative hemolysin
LEIHVLEIGIGLLLVAAMLYTSTLSYALRDYSRGRLATYLSEERQRTWFERLDRYETQLQAITGFTRMALVLATCVWIDVSFFRGNATGADTHHLVAPMLAVNLLILLFFAIGIPHALSVHACDAVLARNLTVLWILRHLFFPIEKVLDSIEFLVRRLLGKTEPTEAEEVDRMEQEILDAVSEGELHGAVDEEQKEIIESVFELNETQVSEIMTPRTDIVAIAADATYDETRRRIIEAGHSRIPVYEDTLDQIIGVLYAKDLIRLEPGAAFDVRKMMRIVPYVPETKTIDELLRQLRTEKVHIAIVLDEYGGTAGLVSIEDILEELVGEIEDEYDPQATPEINVVDDDTLDVDARARVCDINDALEIQLPEDGDYDTVGGFIFTKLGRIPVAGDEFAHDNIHFVIMEAEPRKINRLRVHARREAGKVANGQTAR